MSHDETTRAQERMYEDDAEAYDALVSAEDAEGALPRALRELASFDGARVLDVGAGTGRLTRVVGEPCAHVDLIDRAAPMLEVARRRLAGRQNVAFHEGDARALPFADASYDVAMAGWVFGHFRHWMPEGWRKDVGAALDELHRVVRPGGTILVIETLGTGHTTPRRHEALDEVFALFEERGLSRRWIRTDYRFPDAEAAAQVLSRFFGPVLTEQVRAAGSNVVPECTGIFSATRA